MKKPKKGKPRQNGKSKKRAERAKRKKHPSPPGGSVAQAGASFRYAVKVPGVLSSPSDLRHMQEQARGPLANAWQQLIVDTMELWQRAGIHPLHSSTRQPIVAELDSISNSDSTLSALRRLSAVINSSRQMEDFSPEQVRRMTVHMHHWVTPQTLSALPWDYAVVLCDKLVYALLAYEAERTNGDWELAECCARHALFLMEKHAPDDSHRSDAIDQLGTVLLNRRNINRAPRLREAETLFKTNLDLAARHRNFHEKKRALLNLGILNQELARQEPGRLQRAIAYFDELEELNERIEPEARIREQALTNRGWALIELPRDQQPDGCRRAVADLQRAVGMCRQGPHHPASLAHALLHLGLAQEQLSEYEPAQREVAQRTLEEARDRFRQLQNRDGYSRAVHNLGLLFEHEGEHEKALAHYFEALQFRRGRAIEEWETLGNITDVRVQSGMRPFGAAEGDAALLGRFNELIGLLADHGDSERELKAHYYGLQLLGHAPISALRDEISSWTERAIARAEFIWSTVKDPLSRYHLGRWLGTFYATRLVIGIRRGEPADALLRFAQNGKARTLFLDRQNKQTELPGAVDSEAMAARLRQCPGTAFVEIGISSLGTAALTAYLRGNGELSFECRVLDVREGELLSLLTRHRGGWHWHIEDLRRANAQTQLDKLEACAAGMDRILGVLFERLLGPITANLRDKGIQDLVLAVHGPLAAFPLAAAWRTVGSEVRYLVEDFRSISLTPSVASFVHAEPPRELLRAMYVIGNANELPQEAVRDGQQIAATWRQAGQSVSILKNPTPEEFLIGLDASELLHAVCHGLYDPWRLSASGIQVGGNELLSCERLLSNPAPKSAALVVLCACRSGRSRSEDFGAEWLGISGILLRHGVQAVLSALWDVDYGATFHLSRSFYEQLLVQKQPAAIAFCESMRFLLHEGRSAKKKGTAHWFLDGQDASIVPRLRRLLDSPWLWAGMQIIGTTAHRPD